MTEPTVDLNLTYLLYPGLNIRWKIVQVLVKVVQHSQRLIRSTFTTTHIQIDQACGKVGGDDFVVMRRSSWNTVK